MSCKILSIDGGGSRGIIPATILQCIQQTWGIRPLDIFDLFAGTSTGGIICTALAHGTHPDAIVDIYLNHSSDIFFESFLDEVQGLDEHLQANYSNHRLKKIVTDLFQTQTLGDLHQSDAFGKKNKKLMVTSFDLAPESTLGANNNYQPAVFHSSFIKHKDILLTDLCLMTSAGPTYFPIYQQRYIDGGVALNNPTMAAISFAINQHTDGEQELYAPGAANGKHKGLGWTLADLQVFSLSTGTGNTNRIEPNQIKSGNWGNIQWIKYLPDLLTETNMQSTLYYVKQLLHGKQQYYRFDLFFDDPIAPTILKKSPVGMDTKSKPKLEAMHIFAKDLFQQRREDIAVFLGV